jgi:hypothetical protein
VDLLDLHGRLGTALALYFVALGLWGIALGALGSGPSPAYRGAIVIVEIAIVAQGAPGVLLWLRGLGMQWIHALYGLALLATMPLAASIVREGSPRRTSLALGVAALFAAGLCVRGITTA